MRECHAGDGGHPSSLCCIALHSGVEACLQLAAEPPRKEHFAVSAARVGSNGLIKLPSVVRFALRRDPINSERSHDVTLPFLR